MSGRSRHDRPQGYILAIRQPAHRSVPKQILGYAATSFLNFVTSPTVRLYPSHGVMLKWCCPGMLNGFALGLSNTAVCSAIPPVRFGLYISCSQIGTAAPGNRGGIHHELTNLD